MNAQLQPAPQGRVIYDEPAEVYYERRLDVANNSGLKIIDERSPAHYRYWVENPDDDKDGEYFDFGKLFHCAALEPDMVDARFGFTPNDAPRDLRHLRNAKAPSKSTLESIAWWDDWEASNAGRIMVPVSSMDTARRMGDSLRSHVLRIPTERGAITIRGDELLAMCRREVTYRWTDPRTGVACKSRADLECGELAFGADLKSAIDASPEAFARAVARHRYHQQHVHYCDGAQAAGTPWRDFLFPVVEKNPPYVAAVYIIPAMAEERGRALRDRAMDTLARCLRDDHWPGYTNTITELNLPAWAYYDERD